MKRFLFSGYSRAIAIIGVIAVVIGIPIVILGVRNQQILQQLAWSTEQSANATCDDDKGIALIHVSFSNTEPGGASNAMEVTVEDTQTGKSIDLGVVQPGHTATGDINTGESSINSGSVIFHLSWADGHGGKDTRSASYSSIACHVPTPTFTSTPTPTVTKAPSVTPTQTVTPTPSQTPTPSVCVAPKAVTNVTVTCSSCTNN